MPLRRPNKTKNPPIFSHEFIIQNHADIISCVAMVFVIGLMFQATTPVASMFIAMQHNMTINETENGPEITRYTNGTRDAFTVFFYFLITVVIHAIIQEYVLDKINRKLHLSKVKHSKFNESGQLLIFYLISAFWGADILTKENFLSVISGIWEGYPHANLTFSIKFFFILQIAYWLHSFPELYFQKVKKDEISARVQYAMLYLIFITAAYLLNFTRLALVLLVMHYCAESVFHAARLLYFSGRQQWANTGFVLWNVLFVLVRLGTITLSVLTFWYGLMQTERSEVDFAAGNFNTKIVRINCLVAVGLLQAYMMWNFVIFHLQRMRERAASQPQVRRERPQPNMRRTKTKKGKGEVSGDSGDNSEPGTPVAQENGTVRQRHKEKTRS